jgi:predicted ATPase
VTYRPSDMLLARHPFLQIKPDLQARGVCRELALEFLSQADVAEYLSLECPGHLFPLEFSRLIHAKTEGSPLFVADLVRYLRDRGALTPSSGGWALAETLPSIERELPESMRGMIERKIAQLSDDDRALLAAASVQGYEFDSAVVAQVLNLEADLVEERLETLERVFAFVRLTSEVELPNRTLTLRYRFVHVLYQNALYASLRATRRATLNAAVAGVLVRIHGAQKTAIAAQLAVLYAAARDFTPAVEYFLLASQQATRVFAHAEGTALASRGLELLEKLPESPDRARLELRLRAQQGGSLMVLKGFGAPEVLATYTRQCDLSRQLGDDAQLLRSELGLSIAYTVRAEYWKAQELAAGCLSLATATGDDQMRVQAHFSLGLNTLFLADLVSSRRHFEATMELYDPSKHRAIALYGAIVNRAQLSRVMIWLGDDTVGRTLLAEAFAAADAARHPVGVINTLSIAAFIEAFYRRPAEIIAITDRMIALAEEYGYPYFRGIGLILGGLGQTIAHRDARGIDLMHEGLAVHQSAETWQHQTTYLILLAEALGEIGRTDEGLRALVEAETAMARTGERYYEAGLHEVRARLQAQQGDLSAAEASFARSIDVARRQRANGWEARAATSLARLWSRQGRQEEADRLLANTKLPRQEGR